MGAMMKHGDGTRLYALSLMRDGVDTPTVSAKTKVGQSLLRTWKRRYLDNGEEEKTAVAETVAALQSETALQEIAASEAEEAVAPVAQNSESVAPVLFQFTKEALLSFHPADAIYYAGVGLVCYAVTNTLPVVGWVFAVIWFSLSAIALQGVKTTRGAWVWLHILLLTLLEIGGAAVHLTWSNEALWSNVKALPFDIWENKYRNDLGEIVMLYGGETDRPFYVACGIAVVLFFGGVYAVLVGIQNKKTSFTAPQVGA